MQRRLLLVNILFMMLRGRLARAWISSSSRGGMPSNFFYARGGAEPQPNPLRATYSSAVSLATNDATFDAQLLENLKTNLPTANFGGILHFDVSDQDKYRVIFVLGGPGAGKGTQSELMAKNYPAVHLSVGHLLREEQTKEDSPHKDLIQNALVSGNIVPVEISLQLLKEAMREKSAEVGPQSFFLVDGFPRNYDNLSGWCRLMSNITTIAAVLSYQCPLHVLEERILERAKDSGRSDDNIESLKKRFRTFESQTVPVIEQLKEASKLARDQWSVVEIRGDQRLEQVWISTQQILNQLILHDVLTTNSKLLKSIESGDLDQYRKYSDPLWFERKEDPLVVMQMQEGVPKPIGTIEKAQLDVISGRQVAVSYNRIMDGLKIREKRIWTHQGQPGWRNVHFSRTPL